MQPYVSLFIFMIISIVLAIILTPIIKKISIKIGLMDTPNPRRINQKPMPTGGGVSIFLAFFITSFITGNENILPYLIGGGIILLIGLADDYYSLSAGWKFVGQSTAVLIFVLIGPRIEFIASPWGGVFELSVLSIPLTTFWILSVINIINFIDGIDGLASGISIIAALALFSIVYDFARFDTAVLFLVLAGAILGFLPYNFNPAKIYLGDAGAMFIGFMLGAAATEGVLQGVSTIGLMIPILILAVPVIDAFCAIIRRLQQGVPVYQADSQHFHHRLLDLGLNQRQVAVCAYMLSLASASTALYLANTKADSFLIITLIFIMFLWGAMKIGLVRPIIVKAERRVL